MLLTSVAFALDQPLPFAEACARAPMIAEVEVTSQEGRWSDVGIETWIDVVVTRTVRGTPPDGLTLVVIGGQVGRIAMNVPDTPKLQTDHRYTLLLEPRQDGRWSIFGGKDGVAPVGAEACHVAP